ncbi:MAG: tetratricopeptide repeat protein, partial [Rhizobacter sp.]
MKARRDPPSRPMAAGAAPIEGGLAERLEAAVHLLRAERLDDAAAAFDTILAKWPEQPDALHFLGVLRHVQGQTVTGIALIRRALAVMPIEPGPWNNLGNVLVEAQRLDEAIEAYRTSIAVSKGTLASTDALNNIGTVLRKRGELVEAERAYREAIALRPGFMEAWYNLSVALMNQGRINEGLLANSKAIVLSPRHLQARDQVIRALLLQGER